MFNLKRRLILLPLALLFVKACLPSSNFDSVSVIVEDAIDGIDVQHYHVTIEPNLEDGTVLGHEKISFRADASSNDTLEFNGRGILVLSATLEGKAVTLTRLGSKLHVPLPETRTADQTFNLDIQYEANPERGYTSNEKTVFTTYFACDWMICRQDAFGDKSTVTLEIKLPREMNTLGPGQMVHSDIRADGSYRVTWHEGKPYSPYLYAFAAGDFSVFEHAVNGTTLQYVSPIADEAQLKTLFEPTEKMLAFFERKAGVSFPQPIYAQLYVDGRHAQEAVSHSIIGARMLDPILETPQEDWVIAHELAHQWWGNAITCKKLSHFWLNEGLTVFMVAAWKEVRWGEDAYQHEIALARRRYEHAKTEEFDVPLSFDGDYPNRRVRAAIQYSKGVLFFDALRGEMGDDVFWMALKFYTQNNMGKTVTSRDLQYAFEQSSGQDLSKLFDAWVY